MALHPMLLHTAALLTSACFAGLWQGAAMMLIAAAVLRLMPRASAALRHTILVFLFGLSATLPWVHSRAPQAAGAGHALHLAPWFALAVGAVWIVAATGRGLALVAAWRHLRRVQQNAQPIEIEGIRSFTAEGRAALLCSSTDVEAPMILGFLKPRLLLPAWMLPTLDADDLRQIALHECEHLRRGDDWINLLLQIGLMLSPLNPALIWLNRRIGVQRELACDAAVIASTARPLAYAACLTRLAEQRMQNNPVRLALAAWTRKSELSERVHTLLRQTAGWNRRQSGVAAAVTAAVLLAASTGFAHAPQFIRVTEAVATEPIATVMPQTNDVALARAVHTQSNGMRMVPAAFHIQPADTPMRSKTRAKKKLARVPPRELHAVAKAPAPAGVRLLRTDADLTNDPPRTIRAVQSSDDAPVRMITTEFSPAYVAVPMQNGWLLIQL